MVFLGTCSASTRNRTRSLLNLDYNFQKSLSVPSSSPLPLPTCLSPVKAGRLQSAARTVAHAPCGKMAPAGSCYCLRNAGATVGGRVLMLLLLVIQSARLLPGAWATEHYSPLSLLKQELQHRQQQEAQAGGGGCSPQSGDWEDHYSAECGGEWAASGGCLG